MNLRLFITVWMWRLLVWCNIANTSINLFCFCESLLLGRKYVRFKWFLPIAQHLDDVRQETASSAKPDKNVGQIEFRLTEAYCVLIHTSHITTIKYKNWNTYIHICTIFTKGWFLTTSYPGHCKIRWHILIDKLVLLCFAGIHLIRQDDL